MVTKSVPQRLFLYPSFFKVLIGHDFSNKLLIPQAFVKHFDGNIPNESLLGGPTERFWPVNVEKSNNRLLFNEGWSEFVRENCLEIGDFLVFHYVGNSEFHVEIYGKNCCQKRVNVRASKKRNMSLNVDMSLAKEKCYENSRKKPTRRYQVQNLDDLSSKVSGGRRARARARASQTNPKEIEAIRLEREHGLFQVTSQTRNSEIIRDLGLKDETNEGKMRALEAAEKHIPKNPFFKCVMHKAYVANRYTHIPVSFSRTYIGKNTNVKLEHSGNSWTVNLWRNKERRTMSLSSGWGRFLSENAIKLGDVCVFELIESNDMVMRVSIFRC